MPRSGRHCFCNLCKGNALLSSFKLKQHLTTYGLWDTKKSSDDKAAAKKSRVDESDSSASDREPDDDDTHIEEEHGDYDSDIDYQVGSANSPASAKVRLQYANFIQCDCIAGSRSRF